MSILNCALSIINKMKYEIVEFDTDCMMSCTENFLAH